MNAKKARKLTSLANKNVEMYLSPFMINRIQEAAEKGNEYTVFTESQITNDNQILLRNLGYKVEQKYILNLCFLSSYYVVSW